MPLTQKVDTFLVLRNLGEVAHSLGASSTNLYVSIISIGSAIGECYIAPFVASVAYATLC